MGLLHEDIDDIITNLSSMEFRKMRVAVKLIDKRLKLKDDFLRAAVVINNCAVEYVDNLRYARRALFPKAWEKQSDFYSKDIKVRVGNAIRCLESAKSKIESVRRCVLRLEVLEKKEE